MRKTYSVNFYLILFIIAAVALKFLGFIYVPWTQLFSYISMFWGMSMFYYSSLKQNQPGIFLGAILFQIGVTLLSLSLFEVYQPAKIFIPALLTIIGSSLLITNLIGKSNKLALILSTIFLFVGVLLIIFRGNLTPELFVESVYQLLKNFWLIIIILAIIITLVTIEFRNEKRNQN